tara:strand:- start:1578 stop:2003 length:426 start_codon:yes stop_codon:yes gene_type:complete
LKNLIKKYYNGFTLVEILIVVVIVGILAAIAIPTYNNYVKKGYATEAKTQIKNIVQAAELYATENGDFPPDCWETMKDEGFLEIKKSVTNKWEFECNFAEEGEGGTISATSTEEMSGGSGNTVEFDIDNGRFTGYGQSTSE